jgi:PhoH-like ATPase
MHDPTAIFRFEEHDVFVPMIVLEELDAGKKGMSEAARNVRQVSRFLDELMANASKRQIVFPDPPIDGRLARNAARQRRG